MIWSGRGDSVDIWNGYLVVDERRLCGTVSIPLKRCGGSISVDRIGTGSLFGSRRCHLRKCHSNGIRVQRGVDDGSPLLPWWRLQLEVDEENIGLSVVKPICSRKPICETAGVLCRSIETHTVSKT